MSRSGWIALPVLVVACGSRTLDYGDYADYGDYGDYGVGGGSGGAAAAGKGGKSGKGGTGPKPAGGSPGTGGKGAGVAGTASHGGAAGYPIDCPRPLPLPGPVQPLIDDMEDGDPFILPYGRSGSWYTYNDTSGMQTPSGAFAGMWELSPPRESSHWGAFTTGYGFKLWGAGIGFLLNAQCPYDARSFAGIRFFARETRGAGVAARFSINTAAVTPIENGGTCAVNCWDSHGSQFYVNYMWQEYAFTFSELVQQGFGTGVPFDSARLMAVQFQIPAGYDFELTIDDVSFF